MNQVVPSYILYFGLLGIFLLFCSVVSWFVFYFRYEVNLHSSVNKPDKKPTGWKISGIITLVTGILGFIFSLFIIYGHYLLDCRKDNTFRKINNVVIYDRNKLFSPKVKKYQIKKKL